MNIILQFVLVNVVVAVLMKHLEESNATNQAELEEDGDLAEIEREKRAEEHAAKCTSPANRNPDSNQARSPMRVSSARQSVDVSAVTEKSEENTASPLTLTTTVGPTTHDTITNRIELTLMATKAEIEEEKEVIESPISSSINVPVINVTKTVEDEDPHSSLSTLNRDHTSEMKKSFEEYDPESTEEELKQKGLRTFSISSLMQSFQSFGEISTV